VAALHQRAPGQMTGWKIHSRGSALFSPAYCFASVFYFDGETALAACVLRATTKKGRPPLCFIETQQHNKKSTTCFRSVVDDLCHPQI